MLSKSSLFSFTSNFFKFKAYLSVGSRDSEGKGAELANTDKDSSLLSWGSFANRPTSDSRVTPSPNSSETGTYNRYGLADYRVTEHQQGILSKLDGVASDLGDIESLLSNIDPADVTVEALGDNITRLSELQVMIESDRGFGTDRRIESAAAYVGSAIDTLSTLQTQLPELDISDISAQLSVLQTQYSIIGPGTAVAIDVDVASLASSLTNSISQSLEANSGAPVEELTFTTEDTLDLNGKIKDPKLISTSDGGYIAVYQNEDTKSIEAQRFDVEGNQIGQTVEHSVGPGEKFKEPTAVETDDGGFMLLYGVEASTKGIGGQAFDANGNAIGESFTIDTEENERPDDLQATALDDGSIALTFTVKDKGYVQLIDQTGAEQGEGITLNDAEKVKAIEATVLEDGTLAVSYQDDENDALEIELFDSSGQKIGDTIHVDDVRAKEISMTGLSDGSFVIAYSSDNEIFTQRFDHTGETMTQITSVAGDDAKFKSPTVNAFSDGSYVVSYYDDSDKTLRASRFDANDSVIESNVLIAEGKETKKASVIVSGDKLQALYKDDHDYAIATMEVTRSNTGLDEIAAIEAKMNEVEQTLAGDAWNKNSLASAQLDELMDLVDGLQFEDSTAREEFRAELETVQEELAAEDASDPRAELREEMLELQGQINTAMTAIDEALQSSTRDVRTAIRRLTRAQLVHSRQPEIEGRARAGIEVGSVNQTKEFAEHVIIGDSSKSQSARFSMITSDEGKVIDLKMQIDSQGFLNSLEIKEDYSSDPLGERVSDIPEENVAIVAQINRLAEQHIHSDWGKMADEGKPPVAGIDSVG